MSVVIGKLESKRPGSAARGRAEMIGSHGQAAAAAVPALSPCSTIRRPKSGRSPSKRWDRWARRPNRRWPG